MGMAGIHYFYGALILGLLLLQVSSWANRVPHQCPREVADARHRRAHSVASRMDDSGQALPMTAAAAVGRESGMTQKSQPLEMSALCVLFILLSLWGIVWDFTSGLLTSGIDGIMLLPSA